MILPNQINSLSSAKTYLLTVPGRFQEKERFSLFVTSNAYAALMDDGDITLFSKVLSMCKNDLLRIGEIRVGLQKVADVLLTSLDRKGSSFPLASDMRSLIVTQRNKLVFLSDAWTHLETMVLSELKSTGGGSVQHMQDVLLLAAKFAEFEQMLGSIALTLGLPLDVLMRDDI